MFRLFTAATLVALLGACTSAPSPAVSDPPSSAAPQSATPKPAAAPERAIPGESVYPLLLAEFALRRKAYDIALEQYLEQSQALQDRGVSAHTTHIAQFMQREAEALQAVQLWAELEPDSLEANDTLATLLARAGRTAEALPHLAVIARQGEQANFPMLLNRFRALSAAEQQSLVAEMDALSAEIPSNTSLLLTRALAHDSLERPQQTLQILEQLFALEPNHHQGLLLEAKLLLEQNAKEPFAHIESALNSAPDDDNLRLKYARLLTRGDMSAARKQFEILSANSPRDGNLLFSLALINHEIDDNLAAKAYLRQLLALGQRVDEAHYYLGRIAEQEGHTKEAIASYMALEEADSPDFFRAKGRLGHILLNSQRMAEAKSLFDELRQQHPNSAERLYVLESELFMRAGHSRESLQLLNRALDEQPNSSPLRYSRAILAERQGDLALMESDLRTILEREPDNATALNALGYSLANRNKRLGEAEQLIAQALALQPGEPAILDSMGWVLYRQARYSEALSFLERAFAAFPDPEVAAHLGEALWMSGDKDRARSIWRKALQKAPQHEVLLSTIQRFDVGLLQVSP
ncbi:tetratricopeptide repeat protein [Parahaliea sp. F7430]|uniref:Tetratricopeptide repeat protein n=1 Tax=Sediminihaliea albiluteola TaxID=2758564 RepID=A0A7W2TW38_9GAMM|nr:tetratricopeptide repeat protein [Sediminihaliea albiluteola]MBA6413022.1 tetratricopeptide repeat protein [Sediminihaliea albiluteola]